MPGPRGPGSRRTRLLSRSRLDLGRPKRQPGAVADAPVGDHEPSDLDRQALTDPRRRRARDLDLEDLAALLADAEQPDRVQRIAVGVGPPLAGPVSEQR